MRHQILALSIAALVAVAPARAVEVFAGRQCMGTVLEITIDARSREHGRALLDAAFAEAGRLEHILSDWSPDTELSRFNAQAGHGSVRISPELADVLTTAHELYAATDGAFDVTLGPVILLKRKHVTDPHALRAALELVDGRGLAVSGQSAALARPGMAVDLGGIGKGFACDRLRDLLMAGGARSGTIDFGQSSQLVFGARPRRMGIRSLSGIPHARIELHEQGLSTSDSGRTESTLLDPRSGLPVTAHRQATVVASTGAVAEGWTKPLVILGRAWLLGAGRFRLPGHVHYEDEQGVLDLDQADLLGQPPGHGAP